MEETNNVQDTNINNRPTNVLAIIALILAFIFPLFGLILGIVALNEIKKTNEKGKTLAIVSIVLSIIFMIISVLVLFFLFQLLSQINDMGKEIIDKKISNYTIDLNEEDLQINPASESDCLAAEFNMKKWICYRDLAISTNNIDFCKNAGDYRAECLISLDKNKQYPIEKLSDICNEVKNSFDRDWCYEEIAAHRKEISLCSKVTYDAISCAISVDEKHDLPMAELTKICESNAYNNSYSRAYCFIDIAIHRKDIGLCKNSRPVVSTCIEEVDINHTFSIELLSDVCDSIEARTNWELFEVGDCFTVVAVTAKDGFICKKATRNQAICLEEVDKIKEITKEEIISVCSSFETENEKASCFMEIAGYKGDKTICDELKEEYRESCLAKI